jgi:hypothetical protein
MSLLTFIALSASVMGLLFSIGALFATARLSLRYQSTSAAKLSGRLTDLEGTIAELASQLKNMRARLSMQAYRHRKLTESEEPPAPVDEEAAAAETRARLNHQLAARGAGSL